MNQPSVPFSLSQTEDQNLYYVLMERLYNLVDPTGDTDLSSYKTVAELEQAIRQRESRVNAVLKAARPAPAGLAPSTHSGATTD